MTGDESRLCEDFSHLFDEGGIWSSWARNHFSKRGTDDAVASEVVGRKEIIYCLREPIPARRPDAGPNWEPSWPRAGI